MIEGKLKYTPFARKYRPSKFSELMGQEVLVKTISYSIQNDRLAQVYLLTGIRGVGKTSSARIIAKTVNCTNLQLVENYIEPCNQCDNCLSFNNGSHPDIIEIDAASRTGVDDIREIIESAEYRPLLGFRKFFVIDEIHMLSKSAFNALLKIIEEPPMHVVFVFATTEVQKIPLTVISRCQRYDLRRFNFSEIYKLIESIAHKEGLKFEPEALKIIASKSEGSARDAVSMLDQAASYAYNIDSDHIITIELVENMLGLLRTSVIVEFTQLIIANNPARCMDLLGEIYAKTSSLENFIQAMSEFCAEACKAKVITDYRSPLYQDYTHEIDAILIGISLSKLSILWQIFSNGLQEIKQSHNELITAQMIIIKAIYSCNMPNIEEILQAQQSVFSTDSSAITSDDNKENQIYEFLKYCYAQKEIELYYSLLNVVGIPEFNDFKMLINGNLPTSELAKLHELLKLWSGKSWHISLSTDCINITTLKEIMIEKVKMAEDYNVIKKYFPEANISDIILKTN